MRDDELEAFRHTPEYEWFRGLEQQDAERIRKWLGRRVVLIFKRGGRIREERRYDSDSDSMDDLRAIVAGIGLLIRDTPIGPDLIGKGYIGLLPWEQLNPGKATQAEVFDYHSPVRVADVIENEHTGITTIYMESV